MDLSNKRIAKEVHINKKYLSLLRKVSKRQAEVLEMWAEGISSKDISNACKISRQRISSIVRTALMKLYAWQALGRYKLFSLEYEFIMEQLEKEVPNCELE